MSFWEKQTMRKVNILFASVLLVSLSLNGMGLSKMYSEENVTVDDFFISFEVDEIPTRKETVEVLVAEQNFSVSNEVDDIQTDTFLITVTEEEIDLMARVVMSESSVLCYDAKVATAQTIVNRVRSKYQEFKNQNTVTEVINRPYQFSTQDNGEVTQECYDAVYDALTYETFPTDMLWFCKSPNSYGVVYAIFGSGSRKTYFSTVTDYEELVRRECNGT